MSLLNNVLRDLDRRHATPSLPPLVASVPSTGSSKGSRAAVWVLFFILVGATVTVNPISLTRTPTAHSLPPDRPALGNASSHAAVTGGAELDPGDAAPYAFADTVQPLSLPGPTPRSTSAAADLTFDFAAPPAPPETSEAPVKSKQNSVKGPYALVPAMTAARSVVSGSYDREYRALAAAPPEAPAGGRIDKTLQPPSHAELAEASFRLGIANHQDGRVNEAIDAFARALEQDPRHSLARRALAIHMIDHGQQENAERLIQQGLKYDARQPRLAIVMARLLAGRHKVNDGIEVLRASLGGTLANPADEAEAKALMGTFQQELGNHRDAIASFTAALQTTPGHGAWWVGLGISLSEEGQVEAARKSFERARANTLLPEILDYVEARLR